jgi:hypothetical protein
MRAQTITTISKSKRRFRGRGLALALAACALAVPASAGASPVDPVLVSASDTGDLSHDSSQSAGPAAAGNAHRTATELGQSTAGLQRATGSQSTSVQPPHGADYSSVTAPARPTSEIALRRDGSQVEPFVAQAGPELVSDSPVNAADGFDWGDAALGAGAAMALVALGGTALFTVRRRPGVSPSASTG